MTFCQLHLNYNHISQFRHIIFYPFLNSVYSTLPSSFIRHTLFFTIPHKLNQSLMFPIMNVFVIPNEQSNLFVFDEVNSVPSFQQIFISHL